MKRFKTLLAALIMILIGVLACDKTEDEVVVEETIGQVGTYWRMYLDNSAAGEVTINENNAGDIVASFTYDGNVHTVEAKITSNGIYDYVYSNGDKSKPFTLVEFDANVGDKWEYNVGNQKVKREVVRKSVTDDVEYGFYYVKTIDVEETIPAGTMVNGTASNIKKILWKFNHKFGFIEADITTTDNTVSKITSLTNAGD
jgi:hypothetical protein